MLCRCRWFGLWRLCWSYGLLASLQGIVRCRYELQNDVAGACSDFNTDSAPGMTLQLGGVLFGTAIACALPKNDRQSERNNVVFMAEVRC